MVDSFAFAKCEEQGTKEFNSWNISKSDTDMVYMLIGYGAKVHKKPVGKKPTG